MKVKVEYLLDNDNWSDQEFEDAQDIERFFYITPDMIGTLINQNIELTKGDFISEISNIKIEL